MDILTLFLQRYDPLHNFYLAGFREAISPELMRQRPHPRLNSIAWVLWHMTRGEDAGLNRFVTDRTQVLDDGGWMERMNLPWRDHGSEMTSAEVDEFNERIDVSALHAYCIAVEQRTRQIVPTLNDAMLDEVMEEEHLRKLMADEGLAHSDAEGFVKNYLGWSKGKCLMTFGLTHPFQHVGEIETIATLLGVVFD